MVGRKSSLRTNSHMHRMYTSRERERERERETERERSSDFVHVLHTHTSTHRGRGFMATIQGLPSLPVYKVCCDGGGVMTVRWWHDKDG